MRIIDLTMPIVTDHVRWTCERTTHGNLARGDLYEVTWIRTSCHAFTHVDARRHFFLDGPSIEATPLEAVVGPCAVIDLMDVRPDEAIGPARLAQRFGHYRQGDIVLLRSGWDRQRSWATREYWTQAPYLTRDAAIWLGQQGIATIAYDFPQDYVIRRVMDGVVPPIEEHVTHDILLRAGVHMIEYVVNAAEIRQPHVLLSAAPLKIEGADGAPARVYAVEGLAP